MGDELKNFFWSTGDELKFFFGTHRETKMFTWDDLSTHIEWVWPSILNMAPIKKFEMLLLQKHIATKTVVCIFIGLPRFSKNMRCLSIDIVFQRHSVFHKFDHFSWMDAVRKTKQKIHSINKQLERIQFDFWQTYMIF